MKKITLFCAAVLLVSFLSTGCSTSGSGLSSWCRTGSLFPTARSKEATEVVYQTAGVYSQCDPCTPVECNPCEPVACNPCEPVCDPCVRTGGIYTRAPIPGPAL